MDEVDLRLIATISYIIVDVCIRVGLIFYVPRGRKPGAAMAWLLAIFFLPGLLGIILYLIIGTTRPSRLRRSRQAIVNSRILNSRHVSQLKVVRDGRIAPLLTLNQKLSKFPGSMGNDATIHSDYLETIQRITKDVRKANHYIYIESYVFEMDSVTEPLLIALERAVQRGVAVYVLFDAVGSHKYKNNRKMKKRFTAIGVHWHSMLPVSLIPGKYSRPDLRNHRKLIAIDNTVAYIGSLNLIDPHYQRKDSIIYEEMVARLQGPIVADTAAIIAGDWYTETANAILHFQQCPQPTIKGKQLMQLVPSGPAYKNENNLKLFLQLIYMAKKQIVITNPYLVPTEPLMAALVSAAQRGVRVVIINSEAVDQWMVGHAQRSYYLELLNAGIELYLHNAPVLLHSKHITIDDDVAIIGSSNMDVRSFELNYECILAIYDKKTVRQLKTQQRRNLKNSYRLTHTIWRRRSVWSQFLDSVARLTSALQ